MAGEPAKKDEVQKASEQSFPASDPPSWTPVTGSGAAPSDLGAAPPRALSIQTILHPAEFSQTSRQVYELACSIARDFAARLVVLHVVEPVPVLPAEPVAPATPLPTPDRAVIEQRLRQLCPSDSRIAMEYRVIDGVPVEAILSVAAECACDLIVMGTHGRTGLSRLLMGSVAENVLRQARCPVLIVKNGTASSA